MNEFKTKKAPCQDCQDRVITDNYRCHNDCPRYSQYREENRILGELRVARVKVIEVNKDAQKRMKGRRKNMSRQKGV